MSNQRILPIPQPDAYYVKLIRSDGQWSRVWRDGVKSRCETMSAAGVFSIVITRLDLGVLYTIDNQAKTYVEALLGEPEWIRTLLDDTPIEDDKQWEFVGLVEMEGRNCHIYDAWSTRDDSEIPCERIFLDPETRMPKRTIANEDGQPIRTTDWMDLTLGPQPSELFEPPSTYTGRKFSFG